MEERLDAAAIGSVAKTWWSHYPGGFLGKGMTGQSDQQVDRNDARTVPGATVTARKSEKIMGCSSHHALTFILFFQKNNGRRKKNPCSEHISHPTFLSDEGKTFNGIFSHHIQNFLLLLCSRHPYRFVRPAVFLAAV